MSYIIAVYLIRFLKSLALWVIIAAIEHNIKLLMFYDRIINISRLIEIIKRYWDWKLIIMLKSLLRGTVIWSTKEKFIMQF